MENVNQMTAMTGSMRPVCLQSHTKIWITEKKWPLNRSVLQCKLTST